MVSCRTEATAPLYLERRTGVSGACKAVKKQQRRVAWKWSHFSWTDLPESASTCSKPSCSLAWPQADDNLSRQASEEQSDGQVNLGTFGNDTTKRSHHRELNGCLQDTVITQNHVRRGDPANHFSTIGTEEIDLSVSFKPRRLTQARNAGHQWQAWLQKKACNSMPPIALRPVGLTTAHSPAEQIASLSTLVRECKGWDFWLGYA